MNSAISKGSRFKACDLKVKKKKQLKTKQRNNMII